MFYKSFQYSWDIPSVQGIGWTTFPDLSISALSPIHDKNHVGFLIYKFKIIKQEKQWLESKMKEKYFFYKNFLHYHLNG